MVIQQGDVLWVRFSPPSTSEPAGPRPCVVLQHDRYNATKLSTVVVAAITSNLKYASLPGNVRLGKGEAGLPKPSVVNITQVWAIDRTRIDAKLGRLTDARIHEIWSGLRGLLEPMGQ